MAGNYYHQRRSLVSGTLPGFPQRAYLAEAEWFYSMAALLGSTGAAAVTFDGDHVLKPGKGFIQLYSMPHSVQAAYRSNNETAAVHGEWEPKMFWPGDGPELQQMVEQLKFGDFILLFEDREQGSGHYIQFGTIDQPLNFRSLEFESGTTKSGVKGWEITGCATQRFFYHPQQAISLHPDTISFVNQIAFAEGLDLSLQEVWALDRLVRDLHGEANPDYTTYDMWGLGIYFYPLLGGNADSQKYNLFNPLDTDAAFRLAWQDGGGLVHNSDGVKWDGSSYAQTFAVAQAVLNADDGMHGYYLKESGASGGPEWEEYGATELGNDHFYLRSSDSNKYMGGVGSSAEIEFSSGLEPLTGAVSLNRPIAGNVVHIWMSLSPQIIDFANDVFSLHPNKMNYLGQVNGIEANKATSTVCSYWMFHSLSNQKMVALHKAVQAFQEALGREA